MIVARLQGGHSNQLFQYAMARRLADKLHTDLVLDLSWFDDFADVDTPRYYELDCYPIKARTVKSLEGYRVIDPRQPVSKLQQMLRKLHIGNAIWMHYEKHQGFNEDAMHLPDNTLPVGFWQCEKYFVDIRGMLLRELEPKTKLSERNTKLLKRIESTDAISVHVRRGDYVTNKQAKAFHGLLGPDYYKKAVKYLVDKTKSKNLHAFVFSNDIEWCKKNIKLDVPTTFVEGNDKGSDDMRLMKHCKHFVMANSSFSWWGSWLSENPGKITIAPKVWFKDIKTNNDIDIALDSWVRL